MLVTVMAGTTAPSEIEPMAFINGALRFVWAADELRKLLKPGNDPNDDPVYLLMAHAIELALKGFLRLHGFSTATLSQRPYGHNLRELYQQSEQLGIALHRDRPDCKSMTDSRTQLSQHPLTQIFSGNLPSVVSLHHPRSNATKLQFPIPQSSNL